ncbi:tyrosine-type recombinase/integrase [Kaistia dalseonensis]|uniref:Integrase n=1 Tax=Kaistia dalseonensis TaxID=410840 RepID=A0ABU0H917_9HYPH|nr:site-specific integrase [Kaistia dalseonensis]MCX5496185.1 tyrosine-type recombinase/integrase [Kaistia dalseonensis]MDQ0438797.1 integrase [Kaistia dalseonensis]
MARTLHRLSSLTVKSVKTPGRYSDGGGLYLRVAEGGSKQWVFLTRAGGKQREAGLGSVNTVSLSKAREIAAKFRNDVFEGRDPIAERNAERNKLKAIPTFGEMATEVLDSLKAGFRNEKHIAQWEMTLKEYAAPIRDLAVNAVTTEDVLRVLKPIWIEKRETASRLRGRIEKVLDAATAKGLRHDANPARWKGHLDVLLPKEKKATRGHHAAMPFAELPGFMERLRAVPGTSARALEFTVLTAARTGETLGAAWGEIDLDEKVWTVPGDRMKAGREHRVPLPDRAVAILKELLPESGKPNPTALVFPSGRTGKVLSNMSMTMVVRRLKIEPEPTVHGFRSSFRDWCGEATAFPREVAEAALAHTVGDKVEAAYRRGDALEKRRKLMTAWAGYLEGKSAKGGDNVRPIRSAS